MAKFEVVGMQELVDKLNKYHDTPNRVGAKAVRQAGEVMLKHEKQTALKMHSKDRSTGKGAANLKVGNVKSYSGGSKWVGVGFTKEMMGGGSNWDNIKGLYFNHYGYHNNRGGKYVAGSNWLGAAFDSGSNECYEIMKSAIMMELNKIG